MSEPVRKSSIKLFLITFIGCGLLFSIIFIMASLFSGSVTSDDVVRSGTIGFELGLFIGIPVARGIYQWRSMMNKKIIEQISKENRIRNQMKFNYHKKRISERRLNFIIMDL